MSVYSLCSMILRFGLMLLTFFVFGLLSAELTTRPHVQRASSTLSEAHGDAEHCFTLNEIEEATNKFEKRIGSGGFGIVYYGLTKEGKEIAVKVLGNNSYQGKREFANEVTLLSRIHHRNLVQFLGYCQEEGRNMLVYEFMHNGTLKEHLYGKNISFLLFICCNHFALNVM